MRLYTMKRLLSGLLALLALPLGTTSARSLADIKRSGQLNIGAAKDNAPFSFLKAGKMSGFEIELMDSLARKLGVKVNYLPMTFDQFPAALGKDQIDAALGVSRDLRLPNGLTRTGSMYCANISILSNNQQIQSRFDLKNRTIGTTSGSMMQSYLRNLPIEKKVNVYGDTNTTVLAVLTKQVDAALIYELSKEPIQKAYPKAKIYVGTVQWRTGVGILLASENESLKKLLNKSIDTLLSSDAYLNISEHYFGDDVSC